MSSICQRLNVYSDNVLLLRPARQSSGFPVENTKRPEPEEKEIQGSVIVAAIYYLDKPGNDEFVHYFDQRVKPILDETVLPYLPRSLLTAMQTTLPRSPSAKAKMCSFVFRVFRIRKPEVSGGLARSLTRETEVLRLSPTAGKGLTATLQKALTRTKSSFKRESDLLILFDTG